jgi:hypothetical protein
MISRDHRRRDTSAAGHLDRFTSLLPNRIADSHQSDERQVLLYSVWGEFNRLRTPVAHTECQNTQANRRHFFGRVE